MKEPMPNSPTSGGEAKVDEYLARIQAGESKDLILQGLPPTFVAGIEAGLAQSEKSDESLSDVQEEIAVPPQYEGLDANTLDFIWIIPEYADPEKTRHEKQRKQTAIHALREKEENVRKIHEQKLGDDVKIASIKDRLGIGSSDDIATKPNELEVQQHNEEEGPSLLSDLVKNISEGRNRPVQELYADFLAHSNEPVTRTALASALFKDIYNSYRLADYPKDPNEQQVWEQALQSKTVEVRDSKNGWLYRGVMPQKGEETVTRGSFNVYVTPELISSLDTFIASGKIKANYKFGEPGTPASPVERHDAISIYFLEEPSEEVLGELAATIQPYVRGDKLLGKKIAEGFFMSEIGSIESEHIDTLVAKLQSKDPPFAAAVKAYTQPRQDKGTALAMSEAQFYAVKDVARAFGHSLSYSKDGGFELN